MISVLISSVIIAYCIYNLIDIKRFIKESEEERFLLSESIMLVFIYVWLIINCFLQSGPIVIFLTVFVIICGSKNKEIYLEWFFTLLIVTSTIIAVNDVYFNFNMWQYLFNLL